MSVLLVIVFIFTFLASTYALDDYTMPQTMVCDTSDLQWLCKKPENQGSWNACAAYSISYALSIFRIYDSGYYIHQALPHTPDDGTYIDDAFLYAQNKYGIQHRHLSFNYKTDDTIKALSLGRPVICSVVLTSDFDGITYGNPIYDILESQYRGVHAITIIGWDQRRSSFKFINSWGRSWGLAGYGFINHSVYQYRTGMNTELYK